MEDCKIIQFIGFAIMFCGYYIFKTSLYSDILQGKKKVFCNSLFPG